MNRGCRWVCTLAVVILAGCAAPSELARRSEVALRHGNDRMAYDLAKKALDKAPGNAVARSTFDTAALHISEDWKQRIRNVAGADTVIAAKQTLEYAHFRAEVVRYHGTLPPDTAYTRDELALKRAAGRILYERGTQSLEERRPKLAYAQFSEAAPFGVARPDYDQKMRSAFEQGTARIVVLPFVDEVGIPGLAQELSNEVNKRIAEGTGSLRFTRLVPGGNVYEIMTVAQLGRLTHEDAIDLARRLGADQLVWGRIYGLATDTRSDSYRDRIWRKTSKRDSTGSHDVWSPVEFVAVAREREVHLRYEYEVIDANEERLLARQRDTPSVTARTVYTDFVPQGDCGAYALTSPELRDTDKQAAERVDKRWKDTVGRSYTLPKFLECAKRGHERRRYRNDYRSEFTDDSRPAVFLDDLPPVDDLVYVALGDVWKPLLEDLEHLDPVDVIDTPPPAESQ